MKIAIIIFRLGPSHGSILQTYALTKVLEEMGHQVTIIDRQRPVHLQSNLRRIVADIVRHRVTLHSFYMGEFPPVIMKNLNRFIDTYLRKKTITFRKERRWREIGLGDFDAFIVGSDQTWRPYFVHNIYNYYLDFVPSERQVIRLAYAPSFGTDKWEYSKEQELTCKKLISLFDGVSVRESSGVELCKKYFGVTAEHVLDPTLLLSKEHYLHAIQLHPAHKQFVGFNFLDYSEEKMDIVSIISHITGLDAIQINTKTEYAKAHIDERIAPSIDEWISGISNSSFVIADSFHATVFSIIFHRPFITIANVERGLSRFTSLLEMCGLQERLVRNREQITESLVKAEINWDAVDERIKRMKATSLEFLKNSLKKG